MLYFLTEINYKAAENLAKYGYSEFLSKDFGINCNTTLNKESYLEFKYNLDKSIC